jgi:hypothetical protein
MARRGRPSGKGVRDRENGGEREARAQEENGAKGETNGRREAPLRYLRCQHHRRLETWCCMFRLGVILPPVRSVQTQARGRVVGAASCELRAPRACTFKPHNT